MVDTAIKEEDVGDGQTNALGDAYEAQSVVLIYGTWLQLGQWVLEWLQRSGYDVLRCFIIGGSIHALLHARELHGLPCDARALFLENVYMSNPSLVIFLSPPSTQ